MLYFRIHFISLPFMLQPTRKLKSLSLAVLWQTSSFILMKNELFWQCSPLQVSQNPLIHLHEVEGKRKNKKKSSEAYKYYSKRI